jgi:hypothetical protein
MEYSTTIPLSPKSNTIGAFYEAILQFLDTMEIGTDCILASQLEDNDELGFKTSPQSSYYQTRNSTLPPSFSLPIGLYSFEQLSFTPSNKEELVPLFLRFIAKEAPKEATLGFIRIYKEKRFETVVQFFVQKESSKEF